MPTPRALRSRDHCSVISGEDLDADAACPQLPDRVGRIALGRVRERAETDHRQDSFVRGRNIGPIRRHGSDGDAEQPKALPGMVILQANERGTVAVIQRPGQAIDLDCNRAVHDRFRRALDDQESVVVPRRKDREAAPLEVKRDLGEPGPGAAARRAVCGKQRLIQRAMNAGLEGAVQSSQLEHPIAGASRRIEMCCECDPGFCQRAGLVDA